MEKDAICVEHEPCNPSLSKFMDEMLPTKLFYRDLGGYFRKWWVFWSHNKSEISSINCDPQDRIKTALCCFHELIYGNILVQFWAPEEIEGQLHLTTTLQPFALTNLENEKLREYRKHCAKYELLVQDEKSAGIIGRVFRNQLHEFGRNLKDYSVRDYPQRDFALSCGISSTLVLPVFEHSSGNPCLGVLELLTADYYLKLISLHDDLARTALKDQHLRTTDMVSFRDQINYNFESHIQNEIQTAVKQVCVKYYLPLGVTWVSCKHICSYRSYDEPQVSCFQGELLAAIPKMSSYDRVKEIDFYDIWPTLLGVNQGLVGKVFSSHDRHFCRDVCQLSITEYPFVNLARKFGIAASFAVCLRNISTGNNELVIEFSFSREMTNNRDLQGLFPLILVTLKQQLKSFEVVTGQIEIEMFTEFHNQSEESNNDLTSYMAISTPTTSEGDSMQSLGTTEGSMISTCQKPVWPQQFMQKTNGGNEVDQSIPESSLLVNRSVQRAQSERSCWGNSETASTNCVKLFGYTINENRSDIPRFNQFRRTETLHSGMPLSQASANYADVKKITDLELITIKVSYGEDIIKFDLPPSSSYEDLRENILYRWGFLNEKAFVIKYLNDLLEPVILATDMDLHESMVRTRSKGVKLIKMFIQIDDVRAMPYMALFFNIGMYNVEYNKGK